MSEHNETGQQEQQGGHAPSGAAPSSSSVGRELARLREARGWSQEYVSDRLKFAVRQVRALENEKWDELPQGMPLRGFVRNYARLLEVDPAPLLQALPAELQTTDPVSLAQASSLSSPLAMTSRRGWPTGPRKRLAPWLVGGIMALAALALLGYALNQQGKLSFGEQTASTLETSDGRTAVHVETPIAPPAASVTETPVGTTTETPVPPATAALPPAHEPAPTPAPAADPEPAAAPQAGLALKLKQASWVEIRRADGSIAVSRILPANETFALDPAGAPYRVVIGNVNGVDLSWRGAAVDLTPYRRDNVARLTLQ